MDKYESMTELRDALHKGTSRALRATRFADTMLHLMRDYLPNNRDMQRMMYDELALIGYQSNIELINVPIERDHLDKLQLERAMIEQHPMIILANEQNKCSF